MANICQVQFACVFVPSQHNKGFFDIQTDPFYGALAMHPDDIGKCVLIVRSFSVNARTLRSFEDGLIEVHVSSK